MRKLCGYLELPHQTFKYFQIGISRIHTLRYRGRPTSNSLPEWQKLTTSSNYYGPLWRRHVEMLRIWQFFAILEIFDASIVDFAPQSKARLFPWTGTIRQNFWWNWWILICRDDDTILDSIWKKNGFIKNNIYHDN